MKKLEQIIREAHDNWLLVPHPKEHYEVIIANAVRLWLPNQKEIIDLIVRYENSTNTANTPDLARLIAERIGQI